VAPKFITVETDSHETARVEVSLLSGPQIRQDAREVAAEVDALDFPELS